MTGTAAANGAYVEDVAQDPGRHLNLSPNPHHAYLVIDQFGKVIQKIQDRRLDRAPLSALPGWQTAVGLQFKNGVLREGTR